MGVLIAAFIAIYAIGLIVAVVQGGLEYTTYRDKPFCQEKSRAGAALLLSAPVWPLFAAREFTRLIVAARAHLKEDK